MDSKPRNAARGGATRADNVRDDNAHGGNARGDSARGHTVRGNSARVGVVCGKKESDPDANLQRGAAARGDGSSNEAAHSTHTIKHEDPMYTRDPREVAGPHISGSRARSQMTTE